MPNLTPSQQVVLDNILEGNILLSKQASDAVNTLIEVGGVSAGSFGAGAVGLGGGQLLACGSTTGLIFTGFGVGFIVLGAAAALGGTGYGIFALVRANKNENIREQMVGDYIKGLEGNIWVMYFKDEIVNRRKEAEWHAFNRDNETIDSYIRYLTESVETIDQVQDDDLRMKLTNYKKAMYRDIKPQHYLDFHKDLRMWCAYNKVGEFTPRDTGWHSEIWYKREDLKREMCECFKDELKYQKAEDGALNYSKKTSESARFKEFYIIRDELYRMFKAVEYLKNEGFREKEYEDIVERLSEVIVDRVNPDKRERFDMLFKKYRYLGGKGEFDRENVLKSRFYNDLYNYALTKWNKRSNGNAALNIAKETGEIAGITFAAEVALMLVCVGAYHCNVGMAEQRALAAAGDPSAIQYLESIESLWCEMFSANAMGV